MTEKNNVEAQKFISENSKLNEAGNSRSVTQTAYLGYMQDKHHITADTIKAVTNAERELVTGAIQVATADLSNLITAAKKAGDDPNELSASVRISRPSGPLATEVRAQRITTNPSTGEKITHHGVATVKIRSKTMIDPDAAKQTEGIIAALLAGKK